MLRDDLRADSDVDVLDFFEPGESPGWELFTMQDELSRLLGRRIDLNMPGFLSPYFRERVLEQAETVHERA